MNVAFLVYEYAHKKSPIYGGIGTYFRTMAHKLLEKGITVYVYLYNPYFDFETEEFIDNGLKIRILKKYNKNSFLYKKIKKIAEKLNLQSVYTYLLSLEHRYVAKNFLSFINDKKIDIIQSHDYKGFLSHLNTDIPKVIRCSGSTRMLRKEFGYKFDKMNYKATEALEKKALDNADFIIGVSKFTALATQKLFNTKKITVINNGIEINNTYLGAKEIPYSVFYFGSVRATKGLVTVVNVFNKVIEKEPRATLHIIGRGEKYYDELFRNVLTKEAKKNSYYYGQIIRDNISEKIQKGSVFIFPTLGENFPFVFIEAMSLEKPVVVSNIEVSKEIIDDKVDGFIAKSEEDYLNIILDLFKNDEKRKAVGKRAREKVINKFTTDIMVNNTIKMYNNILKHN